MKIQVSKHNWNRVQIQEVNVYMNELIYTCTTAFENEM